MAGKDALGLFVCIFFAEETSHKDADKQWARALSCGGSATDPRREDLYEPNELLATVYSVIDVKI
jgi:hypothetical protein